MKRFFSIITLAIIAIALSSCEAVSTKMDQNYDETNDITYGLGKVLEYDPVNVNGIDVSKYFDFFESLRFTIHVVDGKMTSLSFVNGEIPFSPFGSNIPEGDVDCYLDTKALPHELKVKDTQQVIAYFRNGEFYIPFQLDCKELSYEYRFKEVK